MPFISITWLRPGQSRSQEWLDLNAETISFGSDIRQRILAIKKSYGSDYTVSLYWGSRYCCHSFRVPCVSNIKISIDPTPCPTQQFNCIQGELEGGRNHGFWLKIFLDTWKQFHPCYPLLWSGYVTSFVCCYVCMLCFALNVNFTFVLKLVSPSL